MAVAELAANRFGETLGTYATGYLDAARVLFEYANEGRGLVDLYFYPAALNLRHGLELLAKQCSDFSAYEMRDAALLYVPGHSLKDAWTRGSHIPRETLESDYSYGERQDLLSHLSFLDQLVDSLHALDPSGMLFRYPEYVEKRHKGGSVVRGELRKDTLVPFDRVDLTEWAKKSRNAVDASQHLLHYLDERSSFLRMQRNDPPARLADLVTDSVPKELLELWAKIVAGGIREKDREDV